MFWRASPPTPPQHLDELLPWNWNPETTLIAARAALTLASTNKVHRVTTIARLAEQLGQNEDFLADLAEEMDAEAGLIWVYGTGDTTEGVMAFTDFGVKTLTELIEDHQRNQSRPTPPTSAQ